MSYWDNPVKENVVRNERLLAWVLAEVDLIGFVLA
jgi:hypothetical protein